MTLQDIKNAECDYLSIFNIYPQKIVSQKGQLISYISPTEFNAIIEQWEKTRIMPRGSFITIRNNAYECCEGDSGCCCVECFTAESQAKRWLFGNYEDSDQLKPIRWRV